MSENGFLELSLFFSYFLPGKTICFLSLKLDQLLHLTLLYFTRVSLSVTCMSRTYEHILLVPAETGSL